MPALRDASMLLLLARMLRAGETAAELLYSVGLASIGVSKCGGFMNLWSCGCLKAHVQALKITASKTRMVIRERLEGSSASAFAFSTSRV